jgi:molecular chaperone GrpE (heat shock protein)
MAEKVSAKRLSRDEQRKILWEKWTDPIADIVIDDAMRLSRMNGHDEELFDNCAALMRVYRDSAAICASSREAVTTPIIKDILEGIYSVLASKQEDELPGVNPVKLEKLNICIKTLQTLPVSYTYAESLYDVYQSSLSACLAGLNDLPNRPVTQNYIDLMESEWAVMNSLITVQVAALEAALPEASEAEQTIVNELLTGLREGYQHFGRNLTAFNEVMRGEVTAVLMEKTAEEFTEALNATLNTEDFRAALNAEIDALAEKVRLSYARAAYRFQRLLSEEGNLAEDFSTVFEQALIKLPKPDELPAEAESQRAILIGVAETIHIKIESLKENAAYFMEKARQTVKSFASERRDLSEEDRQVLYEAALGIWRDSVACFADLPAYFARMEDEEPFEKHKAYHEKRINTYTEKIEKSLYSFKRETLLYEMSTYEEILTHSVSRLRESEIELVMQSVALLDETFAALEVLLKKNNIQVMHPAPHDMFNGKEHEVLLAEKHEGFEKGEIIKTINSGYRQNEQIILRANVVAAR